jgi:hypothetical protein
LESRSPELCAATIFLSLERATRIFRVLFAGEEGLGLKPKISKKKKKKKKKWNASF